MARTPAICMHAHMHTDMHSREQRQSLPHACLPPILGVVGITHLGVGVVGVAFHGPLDAGGVLKLLVVRGVVPEVAVMR